MTYSNLTRALLMGAALSTFVVPSFAHEGQTHPDKAPDKAIDHAPIGVMGDHRHDKGEWMLSYRYMYMDMSGSIAGKDAIDNDTIVTTIPNRFGTPATLRVVPDSMPMNMHMAGAMYGLTDNITLMGMVNYIDTEMDHTTYQGMMGTNVLGNFTTSSSGFGDTTLGAIVGLVDEGPRKIDFNLAFSLPTGSITETATALTPMNTTPTLRMPYAMQLGTGTVDMMPGVTYSETKRNLGWGAQAKMRVALTENDENYQRGVKTEGTAWIAYEVTPGLSISGRLQAETQGETSGIDSNIAAPVYTADPDNYGGERASLFAGANWLATSGALKGSRLALEYGQPIYQHVNGVQMDREQTLTLAWQKAF